MFNRKFYTPVMAASTASNGSFSGGLDDTVVTFSSSSGEAEDFNSFHTTRPQNNANRRSTPNKNKRKNNGSRKKEQKTLFIDPKSLIIAAAGLLAFVLLIIFIFVIANSGGSDIKSENNAYTSYEKDGMYYLCVNGSQVGDPFSNEISVNPAADNSFAFVFEDVEDGYNVYLLKKKELTQIISTPVGEIIAWADYEPGIIYRDGDAYYFHFNDNEDRIVNDPSADNFIIAPDASAIVYTRADSSNAANFDLYLYKNGINEPQAVNMRPVEVSIGGEYIYAYGVVSTETSLVNKLYVITSEDGEKTHIDTGFVGITYTNVDGDEVIFYKGTESTGFHSYIYNAKKAKLHKIGAGICKPLIADDNIVCLSSLKDIVVENTYITASGMSATYYINKKYEPVEISQYNGMLSSDGEKFYFVNGDLTLNFVELSDKKRTPNKIAEGVSDFVVTEKDNVYYVDEDGRLTFYKASTSGKTLIDKYVVSLSMNEYSNILFYETEGDNAAVYTTEEGDPKEIAKFAREEITGLPNFINNGQKRCFVYIEDSETGLLNLYYTSTGKSYKLIASDCDDVSGYIEPSDIPTEHPEDETDSDQGADSSEAQG